MNPQENVPTPTSALLSKIDGPTQLFSFGCKLLTGHWKVLVPILILPSISSYIGQLLAQTHQIVFVIIGVLISIASAGFSVAMVPAVVNAVHRISTDPSATFSLKGQYKFGFSYFWPVILIGLILGFVNIGSLVLLVIPGIVIWVYSCLYLFALVIDDKRGFSALTESYALVRGRWWPVFGRILFLGLAMFIIWLILLGVVFIIGAASGLHISSLVQTSGQPASFSFTVFIISAILNLIGTCVIAPIGIGYVYKMYVSLKSVRNPNIQTKTFKRWLIAFTIIGPVVIIMMFISMYLLWASQLDWKSDSYRAAEAQVRMAQIQAEIQKATASSSVPVQQ
jgi:F0F1-type ATP synthase membrane subunit c/vacuolar-type H+-ATPase subunit K